ncbi:FAD/FMN-containing dehydrogenase [Desmospora activa DSM 45169]|uniref:FAD/FMN-containing dehydrogenase n=1 Tax=Desmospora activa DSM 45169 TaxID=1121389 RepID=A0A2T4ZBJ1_9BACL|nr:FAD/FMN-containing dehydrogenase [Desmospora activa DSM 45169]
MDKKQSIYKVKTTITELRNAKIRRAPKKGSLFDKGRAPRFLRRGKEPKLTGRIVVPGNPQYNSARQEFNTFFNKFPRVIVFAQKTQDVVNAIRWARFNNVPIRMRSGRHSYEGLSVVNGGIVIDVSDMHDVDVNRKRGTATVQTGIRGGALNEALWTERRVVPVGLCRTTGIGGVTLGGGHSILSRQFGLTQDHLLAAEIVMADGRVLHANADQHPDLFWALRGGGGGNFGVCTTFRYRTHPINTVAYAEITWDLRDMERVIRVWQEYTAPGTDPRLGPLLMVSNGLQGPSQNPVFFQAVFLGSTTEMLKLLLPLLRTGSPRKATIEKMTWIESVRRVADAQTSNPYPFKGVAPYVHRLPSAAISTIRRFIEKPPTSSAGVFFHGLNGVVAKVPSRSTAYFWRRAWSDVTIQATLGTPAEAKKGIRWVENLRRAMLPFTHGVYVNTPDLYIKNWPQAYYGGNFDRLTRVKAKYDPKNIFKFPQSIPPARR